MSFAGTAVSSIAVPLLALGVTHSPGVAGVAVGLQRLPYLLFAVPSGIIADRIDRRRIMVVASCLRAVLFLMLGVTAASGTLTTPLLVVLVLGDGLLFASHDITEAAALNVIATAEQQGAAFANREMAWSASNIFGPVAGGLLYQAFHAAPFLVDSASYVLGAGLLGSIGTSLGPLTRPSDTGDRVVSKDERAALTAPKALAALSWLLATPQALLLTLLAAGLDFVISGTQLSLIVLTRAQGGSASGIGLMLSIGSTGVLAGYVAANRALGFIAGRTILLLALPIEGVLWAGYLLLNGPVPLGFLIAVTGAIASVYIVADLSVRMPLVPPTMQASVNALFAVLPFGLQALSLGLAGWLCAAYGSRSSIYVFLSCLGVMSASAWVFRRFLRPEVQHISSGMR